MTKAFDQQDVCKTVRIRTTPAKGNPEGITEINASDYDASKHQLVDEGDQPSLNLAQQQPPPSIYGSNVQPAMLNVGAAEEVQLGVIVSLAHSASGKTIAEWNALPDDEREKLIADQLATIREKNGYKPAGPFA